MARTWTLAAVCLAVALLCAAASSAATYYVSINTGTDTNNGTSKANPWAHAPGMQTCRNTCSSTSINAGDQIIFMGNEVWHASNFELVFKGGSSGNPVYYGVDQTWFSGASWGRPVFDGDNSITLVGNHIVRTSSSYVTVDNIEMRDLMCPNANFGCAISFNGPSGGLVTYQNCWLHSWGIQGVDDSNHGGFVNTPRNGAKVLITHNTISNSEYYLATGNNGEAIFSDNSGNNDDVEVSFSVIHDLPASMLGVTSAHDNNIYNISRPTSMNTCTGGGNTLNVGNCDFAYLRTSGQHSNLWFAGTSSPSGAAYFYNNLIHDAAALAPIYATGCYGNTNISIYIYNNVWYAENDPIGGMGMIATDPSGGTGSCGKVYVYNNTLQSNLASKSIPIIVAGSRGGNPNINSLVIQNNHFIGTTATEMAYICAGPLGCDTITNFANDANNLAMTNAIATTQGYTQSNAYAPTALSDSTVGAGVVNPSPCTGCTNQDKDISGEPRPVSGAWNVGAYEFIGMIAKPTAPTALVAIVQ